MFLIGLTGGIAAGKSVVAARLRELGAVHIDADLLARQVVEPGTPALAAIAERFGPSVLGADGALDRAALGAVVFGDPEERRALEGITHPAVRAEAERLMHEAEARDPAAVVVYDVPLLVESGTTDGYDLVVVVHADREERMRRLVEERTMDPEEAGRRIAAQASDEDRLAVADVVIDTNGSMLDTLDQVDVLWVDVSARSA